MNLDQKNIEDLEARYRGNLLNSITGYKSLNLLGTRSIEDQSNLAIFSQIIHLGANPALIGVLFRPVVEGLDSLKNIKDTGYFTLNHIKSEFIVQAHWTAAKWSESEFEKVGLTEQYLEGFYAPFVKESDLKLGLKLIEIHPFNINGTTFVIGQVVKLIVPDAAIDGDGFVDLEIAGSIAGVGLDGYYSGKKISRLEYAKPNFEPKSI